MPTQPTITSTVDDYLRLVARAVSPSKIAMTRQALHLFTSFLAEHTALPPTTIPVSNITIATLATFLTYLQHSYAIETEHAYTRALLNFLRHTETTTHSLTITAAFQSLISHRRRKKQRPDITIPSSTLATLTSALVSLTPPPVNDPDSSPRDRLRTLRDKALLLTLLDTGLKTSEITLLHIANFDPPNHQLTLELTRLPLTNHTTTALKAYLLERAPADSHQTQRPYQSLPLFARHDRRAGTHTLPISRWTVNNIVTSRVHELTHSQTTGKSAHLTPTAVRHLFVASTLENTGDIATTQQRARHKARSTTRHYFHAIQKPAK